MGADLCIAYLLWDKNRILDFKAGHNYVDTLKTNKSEWVVDKYGINWNQKIIHKKLKNIERAIRGNHRESLVIEIQHLYVLIAGGMSYGESPSNLFEDINNIFYISSNIFTKIGFNLPEDILNYKNLVDKIIKIKQLHPLLIGIDKNLDKLLEQEWKHNKK